MRNFLLILLPVLAAGCAASPRQPLAARELHLLPATGGSLPAALPPIERAHELGPAEPAIVPPYQIRQGDVLDVSIIGEADSSRQIVVGPDGRINYLTVKDLPAAGKTFAQLRNDLEVALGQYYIEPQVEMTGKAYAGNTVTVLGMVNSPGRYEVQQTTRLMDVIAMAGGVRTFAYGTGLLDVVSVADLDRSVLVRGSSVIPVDFKGLLDGGPEALLANNVRLKPGDTVYIPSGLSQDNKVFVLGMVRIPKVVRFSGRISFLEAVAEAGGIPVGAWERRAYVVRGRLSAPTVLPVNLRHILTGRTRDLPLMAGDIVLVPKTPLAKVHDIVSQLVPLVGTLETSLHIADRVR